MNASSLERRGENHSSIGSLYERNSVSPPIMRKKNTAIYCESEASYRKYLTSEQITKRQVIRHTSVSPKDRKLSSPEPNKIELFAMKSTAQAFN